MSDSTFTITHSRDESVKRRIATPPLKHMIDGLEHVYPVDPQGMGTWVGVSETGRIACLLNGGGKRHRHLPPYRHSRGLVIPDFFRYPSFIEFYNGYDFGGLEPFTLLVFEGGNIFETVLDEDRVQFRKIRSDQPFLYASSTLYSSQSIAIKRERFSQWQRSGKLTDPKGIVDFHRMHVFEKEHKIIDHAGEQIIKTVSITSISGNSGKTSIDYFDLLNDIHFWNVLSRKSDLVKIPEGLS